MLYLPSEKCGGLAQLARAFDWQSKGQGFDSPILHIDNQNLTKMRGLFTFHLFRFQFSFVLI